MADRERDEVGATGDGLGEGSAMSPRGEGRQEESTANTGGRKASDMDSTAQGEGSIESGTTDSDLSQASGGSVD